MNEPDAALAAFGRATALNPALVASWRALDSLHGRAGRDAQAARARGRVDYLTSLPGDLLGALDLMHEGRLYKAERLCRRFLRDNGHHIEGMRLLAEIGVRLRILDDAEFLLESCVELAPDHVAARADYLRVLNRKGKFGKALEQAEILCAAEPGNPAFLLAKGNALTGLGRMDEGIRLYRKGRAMTANKAGVDVLLGHALKARGEIDAAVDAYRSAYRQRPDYGDAYWSLANIKTYRFTDDEFAAIEARAQDAAVDADDRVHLLFAAGKALEDRGDDREAFSRYSEGNALKAARTGYEPARTARAVDRQVEACTSALFERRGGLGCDAPDPIFIVGLPRAGSTLLEQILSSHSQVDGTMELHEILGLAQRLQGRSIDEDPAYPANLADIDEGHFRRFGEKFIGDTRAYRGAAPYFIDKMPNNFMHVGLIRLILPRARVIDARRHPMACCFSGYKQLFGEGQDFSYDLDWIGRYYADYVRLMDHWDEVLPGFVLRVDYEDVVADLEAQVRRLLDVCGLPFEDRCLEFHRTRRQVRTPSSEQVRQPIYKSGLEHWRRFDEWLGPLRSALGQDVRSRYAID